MRYCRALGNTIFQLTKFSAFVFKIDYLSMIETTQQLKFHNAKWHFPRDTWLFKLLKASPLTQDVNWTYIRRLEDVQDVFWTSHVRSVYVLCLRGYWGSTEIRVGVISWDGVEQSAKQFNPFSSKASYWTPWKHKKQRFSNVFWEHQKETLGRNGISKFWLVLKHQIILILKCLDQVMTGSCNYRHTKRNRDIEW